MNKPEETPFTKRHDELAALANKWANEDGVSAEEIIGIVGAFHESVKFSFAVHLRGVFERHYEERK